MSNFFRQITRGKTKINSFNDFFQKVDNFFPGLRGDLYSAETDYFWQAQSFIIKNVISHSEIQHNFNSFKQNLQKLLSLEIESEGLRGRPTSRS